MKNRLIAMGLWILFAAALVFGQAQTPSPISSDGVSVRNSAPANVFFMFPLSDSSNVTEIQFGCSDAGVNGGWVYIYEESEQWGTPHVVTYPSQVSIPCNETYSPGFYGPDSSFAASLKNDITVTTPDHTVTIKASTAWTATQASLRTGRYWKQTGGSAQIVVQ